MYPNMHLGRGGGVCIPACTWAGVCVDNGVFVDRGCTPQKTATEADGTRPTGIHSCKIYKWRNRGWVADGKGSMVPFFTCFCTETGRCTVHNKH